MSVHKRLAGRLNGGMQAPTGEITIAFTDIEGSTRLWDALGESFHAVLELHNKILRSAIENNQGYEVKTEGDAFMAAFADASNAAAFCVEAQLALHEADWPKELLEHLPSDDHFNGLRVRMGFHKGTPICEPDPRGKMDYFGPMVNLAARVSAAANGGQILCSENAKGVESDLCIIKEHGQHRLKGIEQLTTICEVIPNELAGRSLPSIRSQNIAATNLPPQATSFVGREADVKAISDKLSEADCRMLTVLGPGGMGKTRISERVGSEMLDDFEGGVWFVDLTSALTEEDICNAVARALSANVPASANPRDFVKDLLALRPALLLIFDNFEQVVEHAEATVATWLQAAPKLKVLVTTRFVLGTAGEHEYELSPLGLPPQVPEGRKATTRIMGHIAKYDSVCLFLERARAAKHSFALDASNAFDIAGLCIGLEGHPLAIELAAARVRVMPPAKILKNLSRRFDLLKSSRRDLTPRQQTLRGAIEWSYELLDEHELSTLRQLTVFEGSLSLEAAEVVVEVDDAAPMVMDIVQSLRDKSFLRTMETPHDVRFGMFTAIREYVLEKESALDNELKSRHAEWVTDTVAEWSDAMQSDAINEALDRLEIELANVRAAFAQLIETKDFDKAALLAVQYSEVLRLRGPGARRVPMLTEAWESSGACESNLRSRVAFTLSRALQDSGSRERANEFAQQAIELAEKPREKARAKTRVLGLAMVSGRRDKIEELADDAVRIADESDDETVKSETRLAKIIALKRLGKFDEAIEACERALEIEQQSGAVSFMAKIQCEKAMLLYKKGKYEEALTTFDKADEVFDAYNDQPGKAINLANRANLLTAMMRHEDALETTNQAIEIDRTLGNRTGLAIGLVNRAMTFEQLGRWEESLNDCLEALPGLESAGHATGIATCLTSAAKAARELGRVEEGLEWANRSIKCWVDADYGESTYCFLATVEAARCATGIDLNEEAESLRSEALELAHRLSIDESHAEDSVVESLKVLKEMG
ncbi:MAG: adenylate/guanylate cyclase domain-containing protein [Planctomycetota bacterium]|jgi:predicted ATPase/class 3 adenylate cyclase